MTPDPPFRLVEPLLPDLVVRSRRVLILPLVFCGSALLCCLQYIPIGVQHLQGSEELMFGMVSRLRPCLSLLKRAPPSVPVDASRFRSAGASISQGPALTLSQFSTGHSFRFAATTSAALRLPCQADAEIAEKSFANLRSVVAVDSASDEDSDTIPSTNGQTVLADQVGAYFAGLGASVERDASANMIASFAGRGSLADAEPLALMVHLDTAKGTEPSKLILARAWNGERLNWPDNNDIRVDVATYPSLKTFVGQDVVHGSGKAPVGLDDKLGLTHMMTLAWLLQENPEIPHRPFLLIGRPDEEIGRMEAIVGLADLLKERGVRWGYTVDGIEAYEINVENFNAAQASILFHPDPVAGDAIGVRLVGVNTHGATAFAEGHRAATRLATELLDVDGLKVVGFVSDALRDCDADLWVLGDRATLEKALDAIVAPHRDRGAGWSFLSSTRPPDSAAHAMLNFVKEFLASDPGFTLLAEDSKDFDGYSHPYRAVPTESGLRMDIRIRDFTKEGLEARLDHIKAFSTDKVNAEIKHQYVNMGPRLAEHPELVAWAKDAGDAIEQEARVLPIRGGTGVDPFLDRGIAVANIGTGYFAPESEKEVTSLQSLAGHARWLVALLQQG